MPRVLFVVLVVALGALVLTPAGEAQEPATTPKAATVGGRTFQGEELSADLPGGEQLKNVGSRKDGLGMCVMSSIEMAARWQGLEALRGLRDWCAREGGGAYPSKVDDQLKRFCAAQGVPLPRYVQAETGSPEEILELLDRTRRLACITYGTGERYAGRTIAHMTCCPKFSGRYGVCLDNNFPGDQSYEWMARAELLRRIKHPAGRAWVFAWLDGAPPLPPFNRGP